MRGLKPLPPAWPLMANVASFTDAWIETLNLYQEVYFNVSHLLQMRGLKQVDEALTVGESGVASFTDAWIETYTDINKITGQGVASFTDAWIETPKRWKTRKEVGRIFYRCVD